MSNGHESAQSRRSLRNARETSAGDQPQSPGEVSSPAPAPAATATPVRERRSRRAANAPVDAPSSVHPSTERLSQVRARDREMLRNYRALADKQQERPAEVPTRRQLRLQQQAAAQVPPGGQPEGAVNSGQASQGGPAATDGPEMTVEQALAAREAIIGQAQNQVAMMEAAAKDDPFSVDLEILAQQKALAERAAILNTRAQKIQQLTQENQLRKPLVNDPTTAHNLSIVSPVEFVRAPAEDPSSPAPSTSHIPVVSAPAVPSVPPSSSPVPESPGRSRVLAQAEAMVREQRRPGSDGVTPIRARSAYGLDPLDAMTAGLARVQRMRIVQYSVVGLGALALITGIMMIVGGL
ncbi:hypothetical protein GC088_06740 [Arthrobacter sp. JZ12]|uniref:hypothetical protein n=1 Tax=Arthrobacter sp. JZ12 TaxID=2654190 RepID=UPI002B45B2A3|nr:hypothetical protein [Arthrobacter sp. JZ12]WRH24795.1 hypothetical protein GC088_06740 [Arthrobacter sp. JZ12]